MSDADEYLTIAKACRIDLWGVSGGSADMALVPFVCSLTICRMLERRHCSRLDYRMISFGVGILTHWSALHLMKGSRLKLGTQYLRSILQLTTPITVSGQIITSDMRRLAT